jgi:hypothetical protein
MPAKTTGLDSAPKEILQVHFLTLPGNRKHDAIVRFPNEKIEPAKKNSEPNLAYRGRNKILKQCQKFP